VLGNPSRYASFAAYGVVQSYIKIPPVLQASKFNAQKKPIDQPLLYRKLENKSIQSLSLES